MALETTQYDKRRLEVQELVRDFSDKYLDEKSIQSWCKGQGMPSDVLKAFYASDLGKMGLPEALGGVPADFMTQIFVIEELHRTAGAALPFLTHILSIRLMQILGGEDHFDLVRNMIESTGATGFSEAITEPSSGTDTFAMETSTVTRDGKVYLNGMKMYVSNGQFEPYIMAVAKEEDSTDKDQRLTFWLFPRTLPGVSTYPIETIGQTMTPQAMIKFEDVEMRPEFVIGERGRAHAPMTDAFAVGRILACAASLGLAQAAMDDAVKYASSRVCFGSTISNLAQIQEKITDMEIKIRSMRSLIEQAAIQVDAGQDCRLSAALAKRFVPKAATEVASEALQIFGGLGYTRLTRVGRIWNDCRGYQLAQGTDEIMVRIASKRVIDEYLRKGQ